MTIKRSALLIYLISASCVQVPERPIPLSEQAPQVLYTIPGDGEKLSTNPKIAILFSRPIDETTIEEDSILLTEGAIEMDHYQRNSDLLKAIDKGTLPGPTLTFSVKEEGRAIILSPDEPLTPEKTYTLLVTSRVLSHDRVPSNLFMGAFQTAPVGFVQEFDEIFEEEIPPPEEAPSDPELPEDPQPPAPQPEEEPEVIGKVVLNEIYYDAVGSDTDGVLFVELYGTPGLDIGSYKINFVDGGDGSIDDSITLPDGAKIKPDSFYLISDAKTGSSAESNVPGADLIDNFDPQNGPDAVQLLDATGKLVDAVGYGEGIVSLAENGLAAFESAAAPDVLNGHSLERKEPGLDSDNNANDFVDREIPTPGQR